MSIRNDPAAALKQTEKIEERHQAEAEVRPDAQHRALIFLLKQAMQNNRDCSREAKFHIRELDALLCPDPSKVEDLDTVSPAVSVVPSTRALPVNRSSRFAGRTGKRPPVDQEQTAQPEPDHSQQPEA
jgi:hypothetical protein